MSLDRQLFIKVKIQDKWYAMEGFGDVAYSEYWSSIFNTLPCKSKKCSNEEWYWMEVIYSVQELVKYFIDNNILIITEDEYSISYHVNEKNFPNDLKFYQEKLQHFISELKSLSKVPEDCIELVMYLYN